MNKLFHYAVIGLFAFVLIGSFIIIYYQSVDGVLINKPISFTVDTQHLQTDKTEYKVGEIVSVLFSFCRNRTFTTVSQWKLVNEYVTFYAEGRYVLHPECQLNKYIPIGEIPLGTLKGTHHLEGTTAAKINPLNTIYYSYHSNDFNII